MSRYGLIVAAWAAALAAAAPGAARADAAPGPRLMVTFRASADGADRAAARASVDAQALRALAGPRVQVIRVGAGGPGTAAQAIRALERHPEVAYAEPDVPVHASALPDDSLFASQWALDNTGQTIQGTAGTADADIDAPEAWATTTGSSQVVIGVVDTGMDASRPDLAPNLWTNPGEVAGNGSDDDHDGFVDDVHGWDFVEGDATPNDDDGHGTHVAGIADARGNDGTGVAGVSWQAKLLPVRALDADGNGTLSDVIAAFEYAADRGARIVNASLGGAGTSQTFLAALNRHPGTLLLAAAGNEAADNDAVPQTPCNELAPNVVCVAATDNRDQMAGYSNDGAQSVDLGAPGSSVASTYPGGFAWLSGTSMATPMVTGAAALLLAADPSASVAQLRAWLVGYGDPLSALAGRTVSGRRLNVAASLQAVGSAAPSGEDPAASPPSPVATELLPPSAPASAPAFQPVAPPPGAAADRGVLAISAPAHATRRAVARAGGLTIRVHLPRAGTLRVRASVARATARRLGLRGRGSTATLASVRTTTVLTGALRARLALPARARRRLVRAGTVLVTLSAELVTATGGHYRGTVRVRLR